MVTSPAFWQDKEVHKVARTDKATTQRYPHLPAHCGRMPDGRERIMRYFLLTTLTKNPAEPQEVWLERAEKKLRLPCDHTDWAVFLDPIMISDIGDTVPMSFVDDMVVTKFVRDEYFRRLPSTARSAAWWIPRDRYFQVVTLSVGTVRCQFVAARNPLASYATIAVR